MGARLDGTPCLIDGQCNTADAARGVTGEEEDRIGNVFCSCFVDCAWGGVECVDWSRGDVLGLKWLGR